MSFFNDIYRNSLAENERNLRFWENYLQNLKNLDFDAFAEKLKVPVLVPIGSRILFRGELKHTNEVTVALGADYFTKCSIQQAEVLKQHRIKDAELKLEILRKERDYLENRVSFTNENVFQRDGQEIIEVHTEAEDKAWKEKHKMNVRKWKQSGKERKQTNEITDEELWNRLEELELQEELEIELSKEDNESKRDLDKDLLVVQEETLFERQIKEELLVVEDEIEPKQTSIDKAEKRVKFDEPESLKPAGKFDLLQKVVDKQQELEDKLSEMRNKKYKTRTEEDLLAKLDELEELDELQDEMDRIADMYENEQSESDDESESESSKVSQSADLKRRVCFADDEDSETLELSYKHSDVEPTREPYDPKKGISKPSDVYEVFSHCFVGETTSILKKTKYEDKKSDIQLPKVEKRKPVFWPTVEEAEDTNRTIMVKDIVEKLDNKDNKLDTSEKRPVSLFKQKRQQKKT